jgi:hypothetical protein
MWVAVISVFKGCVETVPIDRSRPNDLDADNHDALLPDPITPDQAGLRLSLNNL